MSTVILPTTTSEPTHRLVQGTDSTRLPLAGVAAGFLLSASTVLAGPTSCPRLMAIRADQTRQYLGEGTDGLIECSTELISTQPAAARAVEQIMRLGHGVFFEDGVDTLFSHKLVEAIRCGGNSFLDAIENFVMSGRAEEGVAAEGFRWIGGMDDAQTHSARWRLLVTALQYPSTILRDGALMGLAAMADRRTLPYLQKASVKPENAIFQRDLCALIQQLG